MIHLIWCRGASTKRKSQIHQIPHFDTNKD